MHRHGKTPVHPHSGPPLSATILALHCPNKHTASRAKYVTAGSAHDLADFPGENRDQRSYRSWLTELLTESYRAVVEHAVAAVFSDRHQEPTTSDALQMARLDLVRHHPLDQARQPRLPGRL
jgi:hypothetical protein